MSMSCSSVGFDIINENGQPIVGNEDGNCLTGDDNTLSTSNDDNTFSTQDDIGSFRDDGSFMANDPFNRRRWYKAAAGGCCVLFLSLVLLVGLLVGLPKENKDSNHTSTLNEGRDRAGDYNENKIKVEPPGPETDLGTVCSMDNIQSQDGYLECEKECEPAACCMVISKDESCLEDNKESCLLYTACTHLQDITPTASAAPTFSPTASPTASPTVLPTISITVAPTVAPMVAPTVAPSVVPSVAGSSMPTTQPTFGGFVLASAPSDLGFLCSESETFSWDGRRECDDVCEIALCCISTGSDNCQTPTNEGACKTYSICWGEENQDASGFVVDPYVKETCRPSNINAQNEETAEVCAAVCESRKCCFPTEEDTEDSGSASSSELASNLCSFETHPRWCLPFEPCNQTAPVIGFNGVCLTQQLSAGNKSAVRNDTVKTRGIMFDVEDISDRTIFIDEIDLDLENDSVVQVFTRSGSHVGHEDSDSGWTNLGIYELEGNSQGEFARLLLAQTISIPLQGTKQAFHVVQLDSDENADNDNIKTESISDTSVGDVQASDDYLRIYSGTGTTDGKKLGRLGFSGNLRYRVCDSCEPMLLPTNIGKEVETEETQGLFFDIEASTAKPLFIHTIYLRIEKQAPKVQVFTRSGTHAHHEDSADGWTDLGTYTLEAQGKDNLTPLVLDSSLKIQPKGTRQAFYLVQLDNDDIHIEELNVDNVDGVQMEDDYLRIYAGTKKDAKGADTFNEDVKNRRGYGFSGTISYSLCDDDDNSGPDGGAIPPAPDPVESCDDSFELYTDLEPKQPQRVPGFLFDVESSTSQPIFIDQISLYIRDRVEKPEIQVFTRFGTHVGHEDSDSGWTDIGTYAIDARGRDMITHLKLDQPVTIQPNEKQALYLVQLNDDEIYTEDLENDSVNEPHATNDSLQIQTGTRKDYDGGENKKIVEAFDNDAKNMRGYGFRGNLRYSFCRSDSKNDDDFASCESFTAANRIGSDIDTKEGQGFFFDVKATATETVYIDGINLNIEDDSPKVQVFSRPGTHVGHEDSADGWADLGTYTLEGKGENAVTYLNLNRGVSIQPNEKHAFYLVQSDKDDIHLEKYNDFDNDEPVVHFDNGFLQIFVGTRQTDDEDKLTPFKKNTSVRRGYGLSGGLRYKYCGTTSSSG